MMMMICPNTIGVFMRYKTWCKYSAWTKEQGHCLKLCRNRYFPRPAEDFASTELNGLVWTPSTEPNK